MSKPREGDRVRMTGTIPEDPRSPQPGDEGTVRMVLNENQVHSQLVVEMDDGSTTLLLSTDPYEVTTDR